MKIENFKDCLKASRLLGRKVSPWEIAYNCLFMDEGSNDLGLRKECDAYIERLLRRSRTIGEKAKLLKELYPWRPHIDHNSVYYALERQCKKEIQTMSVDELWKTSEEIRGCLSGETRDEVFTKLFWGGPKITVKEWW